MNQQQPIESLVSNLKAALESEYERGKQDAMLRIVDAFKGNGKGYAFSTGTRKHSGERAARGSARAFIQRVLTAHPGSTVPAILKAAHTPDEKRVSVSAIRFELYRGKKEHRYMNKKGGQWTMRKGATAA